MKAYLMDVFRKDDEIALWLKSDKDFLVKIDFQPRIYVEKTLLAKKVIKAMKFLKKRRKNHFSKLVDVYELQPPISNFERFVSDIETRSMHKVALYDADIPPEEQFLYKNNLRPFTLIDSQTLETLEQDSLPLLKQLKIHVEHIGSLNPKITKITCLIQNSEKEFAGEENSILKNFSNYFNNLDPDVIFMQDGFYWLPLLDERIRGMGLVCKFHRFDNSILRYKGGKSFFSYGQVKYRNYGIRLKGRFLIDTSSVIPSSCTLPAIIELCLLSGGRLQQISSKTFGAVFQQSLLRLMVQDDILVPYKEKPVDNPISMKQLLKADRAGHTFDAKIGFHKNVAELDFDSMFPWLIYNHNISAEKILQPGYNFKKIPGTDIKISCEGKGLVPRAIKPFLDKRMHYKHHDPDNELVKGLKNVLVTSFGYLRYREFKLSIGSSHMAISYLARETILRAAKIAESYGYEVVHGIVDSLYIKSQKSLNDEDLENLRRKIQDSLKIPISLDGVFKWIVFLPSINDRYYPTPAKYYGFYVNGGYKLRGLLCRQRNTPQLIKSFQKKVLDTLSTCSSKKGVLRKHNELRRLLKDEVKYLPQKNSSELEFNITISKTDYTKSCPQNTIIRQLKASGYTPQPGQNIAYVLQENKTVLPENYNGRVDKEKYKKHLKKSLYQVLQPFGYNFRDMDKMLCCENQTLLNNSHINCEYVPVRKFPDSKRGLSEKLLKRRLEKQGWIVWRGGSFNVLRKDDIYPNVRRKYEKLRGLMKRGHFEYFQYLCSVHHGMPDFFCYRNGEFKFVECKLQYEQLSELQKVCMRKLQQMGYNVEMHKLVDYRTKTLKAGYDLNTGEKIVLQKQSTLKNYNKLFI